MPSHIKYNPHPKGMTPKDLKKMSMNNVKTTTMNLGHSHTWVSKNGRTSTDKGHFHIIKNGIVMLSNVGTDREHSHQLIL